MQIQIQVLYKVWHWRRILGIQLWSQNENAEFSLENTKHTKSKDSASVEIKRE
jgi:hypothetical protein